MFQRLSVVSIYAVCCLTLLAAATPALPVKRTNPTTTVTVNPPIQTSLPASQCNTGIILCCDDVMKVGVIISAELSSYQNLS